MRLPILLSLCLLGASLLGQSTAPPQEIITWYADYDLWLQRGVGELKAATENDSHVEEQRRNGVIHLMVIVQPGFPNDTLWFYKEQGILVANMNTHDPSQRLTHHIYFFPEYQLHAQCESNGKGKRVLALHRYYHDSLMILHPLKEEIRLPRRPRKLLAISIRAFQTQEPSTLYFSQLEGNTLLLKSVEYAPSEGADTMKVTCHQYTTNNAQSPFWRMYGSKFNGISVPCPE